MKGIPEQALERILTEVLGTTDLSEETLSTQIEKMVITKPNEIILHMNDGREITRHWQDRSRSESWTKEMREKVAEQNRKRARNAK